MRVKLIPNRDPFVAGDIVRSGENDPIYLVGEKYTDYDASNDDYYVTVLWAHGVIAGGHDLVDLLDYWKMDADEAVTIGGENGRIAMSSSDKIPKGYHLVESVQSYGDGVANLLHLTVISECDASGKDTGRAGERIIGEGKLYKTYNGHIELRN